MGQKRYRSAAADGLMGYRQPRGGFDSRLSRKTAPLGVKQQYINKKEQMTMEDKELEINPEQKALKPHIEAITGWAAEDTEHRAALVITIDTAHAGGGETLLGGVVTEGVLLSYALAKNMEANQDLKKMFDMALAATKDPIKMTMLSIVAKQLSSTGRKVLEDLKSVIDEKLGKDENEQPDGE